MAPSPSAARREAAVSSDALALPVFHRLSGRRLVLASASPRRKDMLASVGLHPEVVPSTFEEDLPHSEFTGDAAFAYPVETASRKAVEVYLRLVTEDEEDPPDMVIGADTVVVKEGEILEKPGEAIENLRMLAELNDGVCDVITGVAIVTPILQAPGYTVRTLVERTRVRFAASPHSVLQAYVDSGEGLDRAGGFAIQGHGAVLVQSIEGDFNNVVGFPLFSFIALLNELAENEELTFGED